MKFGPASPMEAIGGVTVHTLRQGALVLKKGTTIGHAEVEALNRAGVKEIVVVRLEDGDVSEDAAAASIAQAVAGDGVHVERAFTGRANLFAARAGVLVVDRARGRPHQRRRRGHHLCDARRLQAGGRRRDGRHRQTDSVRGRGELARRRGRGRQRRRAADRALCHQAGRHRLDLAAGAGAEGGGEDLAGDGGAAGACRRQPSWPSAGCRMTRRRSQAAIKELLGLGAELVIVFGASAIADRRDVIPAAITGIGGAIEHFGMPVDPGNLLLIGNAGGVPVLGAPGCARSPVENGFDWVLMRLLAGLKVTRADLTGMGVGGLLMEIVTRPQPRESLGVDGNRNVAAIILAAGRSTRMGGPEQAAGRTRRQAAGADRGRAGAGLEGAGGDRRHRPSGRPGRAGAAGAEGDLRAQSRFRRRSRQFGQGRHRGGAGKRRWRGDLSRRHAADLGASDRPADRGLRAGSRQSDRGARQRRQARQSGAVVAPLLPRIDDAGRRHRRPPSDRQTRRGGGGSRRSRDTARFWTSTPRRRWKPRGRG